MAAPGKRTSYHHGQLRRALLDAALDLATTRGAHNFTLRELARKAGVSHAAPYHHFTDKAALMAELALEIFYTFRTALQAAWDETPGPPDRRFAAVGKAYVRFGLTNPAAFRLMFRPELFESANVDKQGDSENPLVQAGKDAFGVLVRAVQECQASGSMPPGDPYLPAVSAWSLVHGLTTLLLDGVLSGCDDPAVAERMIDSVIHMLRHGLLVSPGDAGAPPF